MSMDKTINELLSGEQFHFMSEPDKNFIVAFDKVINDFGYDYGGIIFEKGDKILYEVRYGKTGTKARKVAATIDITESGIFLRFNLYTPVIFRRKMEESRFFIENAPKHIKDAFTNSGKEACRQCNDNCSKYSYMIDEKLYEFCNGECKFNNPENDKLTDYIELFSKFYTKMK